jgi:pimeloyl-ACP methyl ester carboxylesterase
MLNKNFIFIFGGALMLLTAIYIMNHGEEPHDDIKYLPHELSGNPESKVMLVFLHGWPNTFRMWDKMIEDLKSDHYCLNISYPNFAESLKLKWGMGLMEIVKLIKATVEHVETTNNKNYKKVFVAHDWGSAFSMILTQTYENFVDDLIALDVGVGIDGIKGQLFTFAYQTYLASNFVIGGPIGNFFTRLFVDYFAKPKEFTKDDDKRLNASWNYMYYYFWWNIKSYMKIIKEFKVKCPIAYVYGKRKPLQFHSAKFLDQLKECEKCEFHEIDTGHWVMENNTEFLNKIIRRRENENE